MSPSMRWLRFNSVGAMGMVVQTIALTAIHRAWSGPVVLESIAAVEITLLHNFLWHLRYTWRDRASRESWQVQLLRFQCSNGVVSLAGNAAIMFLLVNLGHMRPLAANAIAILICSIVNFCLGDAFVFAAENSGAHNA